MKKNISILAGLFVLDVVFACLWTNGIPYMLYATILFSILLVLQLLRVIKAENSIDEAFKKNIFCFIGLLVATVVCTIVWIKWVPWFQYIALMVSLYTVYYVYRVISELYRLKDREKKG